MFKFYWLVYIKLYYVRIGFLWLIPYFYTTSDFYEEIAEEYYEKNI